MTRRLPLAIAAVLALAATAAVTATPIVAGLAAIPVD